MTRYRVVPQKDGSYGVEITRPGQEPAIMNRFWTEAEADAWITTQRDPNYQAAGAGCRKTGADRSPRQEYCPGDPGCAHMQPFRLT